MLFAGVYIFEVFIEMFAIAGDHRMTSYISGKLQADKSGLTDTSISLQGADQPNLKAGLICS